MSSTPTLRSAWFIYHVGLCVFGGSQATLGSRYSKDTWRQQHSDLPVWRQCPLSALFPSPFFSPCPSCLFSSGSLPSASQGDETISWLIIGKFTPYCTDKSPFTLPFGPSLSPLSRKIMKPARQAFQRYRFDLIVQFPFALVLFWPYDVQVTGRQRDDCPSFPPSIVSCAISLCFTFSMCMWRLWLFVLSIDYYHRPSNYYHYFSYFFF